MQPFRTRRDHARVIEVVACSGAKTAYSWWRYWSREKLANPRDPKHRNYTGEVSFEKFARAYMEGSEQFAQVGRLSRFVRPTPGGAEVDRIFRYDRLDLLVDFLCEKVGEEVEVGSVNTSPERSFSLSEQCEIELREFFAPEYRIYEQAIGGEGHRHRVVEQLDLPDTWSLPTYGARIYRSVPQIEGVYSFPICQDAVAYDRS